MRSADPVPPSTRKTHRYLLDGCPDVLSGSCQKSVVSPRVADSSSTRAHGLPRPTWTCSTKKDYCVNSGYRLKIVILCGGVGGSKLVLGFSREFPTEDVTVIVNTADDLEFYGLHVSPDLDTVMYTLAGVSNPTTGWGVQGDSFECLSMLEKYGEECWFRIGDKDIATDLLRTRALTEGLTLTSVTATLAESLGVDAAILPMANERVRTRIQTKDGWLPFQEYFVRRGYSDIPLDVQHVGVDQAVVTDEVKLALREADLIVAAPSNPIVSLGPILAVPGMIDAIENAKAATVAVSPIVGEHSITGPAGALMVSKGYASTVEGLAELYAAWLDTLIIDSKDADKASRIASRRLAVRTTDTMMPDLTAKRRLARFVVDTRE